MAKPKRTCFGRGTCIHIGPCCDFWADDGMCVCNPVDAAEYPQDKRLYIAANFSGFSRPNVRTVFPDGSDNVKTYSSRYHYCWLWWEWGGTAGKVTFELRDGNSVRASRSANITKPKPPAPTVIKIVELADITYPAAMETGGNVQLSMGLKSIGTAAQWHTAAWEKPNYADEAGGERYTFTYINVYVNDALICRCPPRYSKAMKFPPYSGQVTGSFKMPSGNAVVRMDLMARYGEGYLLDSKTITITGISCNEGDRRNQVPCWDGTVINTEICRNNTWVPSGESCPIETTHGDKRSPTSCWDGSIIHAEKYDATLHRWIPSGESCPIETTHGDKRSPTSCWDGSIIHAEKYDTTLHRWIPSGESCPVMPTAGSKRKPKTCWDGSIIHAEKFDAVSKTWIPTGESCPVEPPVGAKRASETCWDGTTIYGEVFREGRWVSTGARCPAMPTAGSKRNPTPCWDGSVIHTEIFSGGAWIPSGEACPEKIVRHTLEIAVPKIAYEGQPVAIVGQAFCGAAASHDENATLIIDGATIETKKTKAGEVSFRWTAKGVGMRKVCVNIPASPSCQVPITECETMMVSAHVAGIAEQIKREKTAYEERLTELKKRKKIAAGKVRRPGVPGYVRVPASLAGSVINVGGVKVTVPPGGTTVQVPSGDSIVSVIQEGISTNVPVLVSPGEVINLPTGGLPGLPGGI